MNYFSFTFVKNNIVFFMYNIYKSVRFTKYPTVIQLPVLSKCNYKCVMCDVPGMDPRGDFSAEELKSYLSDGIFKNVKAVGVNGGEPFMLANIEEYISSVLTLKNLRSIHIITNSSYPDKIHEKLLIIYRMCHQKGVKVNVSLSIDGFGVIHDKVRGVDGAFEKFEVTRNSLEKGRHYDSIDYSCTVSRDNVHYLSELDMFAKHINIPLKYRLAIDNKRINNHDKFDDFSVTCNHRFLMITREFFYKKMFDTLNVRDMFKYWSIFEFLNNDQKKRHLGCSWKNDGITLDPKGNLYYCATRSEKIGSLKESKGQEIYFSKNNLNYRKSIVENECNTCIHDYAGGASISSLFSFYRFFLMKKFWHRGF